MAEYTYEDIIMDPEDPRLEGAIGKECYFGDYPTKLIGKARINSSTSLSRLKSVRKDKSYPFTDNDDYNWIFIIIKKEEPKPKPKYVPFENVTEFLDAHRSALGCLNEEACYLSNNGIWLKGKASKAYYMVTKIWDIGVLLVDDSDEITWEELLEYYTFLDGTSCGKEVEE